LYRDVPKEDGMNVIERMVDEKRGEYGEFLKRYDQGPPDEGYSDDEVRSRYEDVAARVTDSEYREAAERSFQRMSAAERQEFYTQLRSSAARQSFSAPEFEAASGSLDDPTQLAALTSRLRNEPDILPDLLNDNLANSSLKAGFAGIAANAINQFLR
jgi:hypothetical protein